MTWRKFGQILVVTGGVMMLSAGALIALAATLLEV